MIPMDRREFCPGNPPSITAKSLMRVALPPSVIVSPSSDLDSKPMFHYATADHVTSPDRLTPEQTTAETSSMHHQVRSKPPVPHHWFLGGGSQSSSSPPQPPQPPPPPPQMSAAELLTLMETSANGNGSYQCNICGKLFGYKNGLVRHVRLTHVGEKPYQCNICNRRFGYKHILNEHQNLHYGNRPYVCTQCDKRFAARSNLIQHQTIHKRPYNCTLCSRRFDTDNKLQKHMNVHLDHTGSKVDNSVWMRQNILPDSSEEHLTTGTAKRQADGRHDNRIDVICSELRAGKRDHVTVKQEVVDSTYGADVDLARSSDQPRRRRSSEDLGETLDLRQVPNELISSMGSSSSSSLSSGFLGAEGSIRQRGGWCPDDKPPRSYSRDTGHSSDARTGNESAGEFSSSALPGIHEVFSRRAKATSSELSSLTSIMPLSLYNNHFQIPDLVLKMHPHHHHHHHHNQHPLSAPKAHSLTSAVGSLACRPRGTTADYKPTAQLPPMAHQHHHHHSTETKDQATQHSGLVSDFPPLEEVLAHYVDQGRLFRCQHCDILFFERGMYFLHSSLHANGNPWQCSICHRVCLNKNEFTLHFVNQQHGHN